MTIFDPKNAVLADFRPQNDDLLLVPSFFCSCTFQPREISEKTQKTRILTILGSDFFTFFEIVFSSFSDLSNLVLPKGPNSHFLQKKTFKTLKKMDQKPNCS